MISICLCIGYSLFGSSSLSTKGKRRFYICVLVQRKIAVWVAKKPDIFELFAGDIFFVSTLWSEWRDLNSRPLDPQSSALPAAPHPVVPKLNLLSTYRLSADSPRRFLQKHSRGTSLEALVPLLVSSPRSNAFIRHRRRHFSSPSCATPGKLINNTTRKAF